MDIDYKRIGRRLRAARKHKNLTQAQVSEILNIAENTYSNMERGQQHLNLSRIIQLCEIYEVRPGSVLDDCSDTLIKLPDEVLQTGNDERRELHLLIEKSSDGLVQIIHTVAQSLYRAVDQRRP